MALHATQVLARRLRHRPTSAEFCPSETSGLPWARSPGDRPGRRGADGPAWAGQPAGFALGALACLPVAVGVLDDLRSVALAVPAAACLCWLVLPEEAWVFALTNGPFGLALGFAASAGYRRPVGEPQLMPCRDGFILTTRLTCD